LFKYPTDECPVTMGAGLRYLNGLNILVIMYKLKQKPDDFLVEEVIDYPLAESGKYHVYKLWKKGYSTIDAVRLISAKLNVREIGYAGLKDKNAITVQFVSILGGRELDEEYDFDNIKLNLVGFRSERLFPGCLKGNKFKIVIRNIDENLAGDIKKIERMVNYFGEQRFSNKNVDIGRSIIKGDYAVAVELINEINQLDLSKQDALGTLNRYDKSLLRLYLHAYQSFLWNKCVDLYLDDDSNDKNFNMPMIGFGIDSNEYIDKVLGDENVGIRDFILRKLQGMGLEGGDRAVFVNVEDLNVSDLEDDELNSGMKKCTVSFTLPKGSYATEYIKQIM